MKDGVEMKYSIEERKHIFECLVEFFKSCNNVISVIQIGSGAIGYKDEFSDLDFAIVVDNSDIIEIFNSTSNFLNSNFSIIKCDNMKERKLQLFLLDNYLEIDIGYYTFEEIYARRKNFKVIYDKSNKVEEKMIATWNDMKEKNKGTTDVVNMNDIIRDIDNDLWYSFMHSIIAFKRNDIFRCYYELQVLKDFTIDLIAKRNNVDSKRYRQLKELSENDKEFTMKLFKYPINSIELKEYLILNLDRIYIELNYWKERESIQYDVDYEYLKNFVEEILK